MEHCPPHECEYSPETRSAWLQLLTLLTPGRIANTSRAAKEEVARSNAWEQALDVLANSLAPSTLFALAGDHALACGLHECHELRTCSLIGAAQMEVRRTFIAAITRGFE